MLDIKSFYLRNRLWIIPLLILFVIFLIFFIPLFIFGENIDFFVNLEKIRNLILYYENFAILIYVLISIMVIVAPPLPNEIVPIVGGFLFGFWKALTFGILARIIGSSINYWLGTKIGHGFYLKFINEEEKEKLEQYTEKFGWQAVFISRFLPSTDTDLIAYASGLVKMNYFKFILASFFGMLVPVSVTILLGTSIFTNKYLFFALLIFYVIGILFIPIILNKYLKSKKIS